MISQIKKKQTNKQTNLLKKKEVPLDHVFKVILGTNSAVSQEKVASKLVFWDPKHG